MLIGIKKDMVACTCTCIYSADHSCCIYFIFYLFYAATWFFEN